MFSSFGLGRLGLLQRWGGGAAAFSPLDLSPTVWYDPSDLSTLFQDSAGTTPVASDGDVVGLIQDKSGNGNHLTQATTANKPLYKTSAGLHWLLWDGVDDTINSPAITYAAGTSFLFGMLSADTSAVLFQSSAGTPGGGFIVAEQGGGSPGFDNISGASGHVNNGAAFANTQRLTLYTNWCTGSAVIGEVRGGTFAAAWTNLSIGYNSAAFPYSGRYYGIVIVPEATLATGTNRADLYTWLAAKSGVTL